MFSKKWIALLVSLTLLACMLLGCQSKADEGEATIVWGTNAEFVPFETKDSDGSVVGVDANIAAAIAEHIGAKLVIEDMNFDSLPAALQSGKIDMIIAGYSRNEEREETMDFSTSYYTARQVVIVAEDTEGIASEEDLIGKTIGVQGGTTGDLFVASEIEGAEIHRYTSMTLACQDLTNGKLDCVIGDSLTISLIQRSIKNLKIVESIIYPDEYYAIAVMKGNTDLLNQINETLAELQKNGSIDNWVVEFSTTD
ncbi:MAG: basic amino acid ABC transporter substrate-binding protein [Christensenellales bacterium]|jgi:ABC-type amino acid transport substrate-binding protein